jgi:cell division transport system permease protein
MKSLKSILSFVIPLTFMLMTFFLFSFTIKVVNDYKQNIENDYSIIIVAKSPILKDSINHMIDIKIKYLKLLPQKEILSNIKDSISRESIKMLQQKLPYFYELNLQRYPTISELNNIKNKILTLKNIKKIEIFSKNHNKIFLLLTILEKVMYIIFITVLIYSIIIISQQIQIWFYENSKKLSIMNFHGASIIYSSYSVIMYGFIASLVSFLIISALVITFEYNLLLIFPVELQSIIKVEFSLKYEIIKLAFLSFFISFITIFGVLLKYKLKND